MKHLKKSGKRLLAMALSLMMCFGLLQTTAFAARNYVVPVYAVGVDSSNRVVSVMPQGFTAKGNTTTQESTTTSGVQNRTWNWTANGDNTYTMTAYATTNVNAFPYIKWPGDLWNMPSNTTYKGYKTFSTPPYVGQSLGAPNAPGYSWQYGKGNFNIQVTNATGTYLVYYFTVPDPTYTYSLTYNGNGGTVNGQAAYTATSGSTTATSYSFNSLTAERSGFEFLGWASTQAAANNGTVDVSWPVTLTSSNSSKTVYAVWKELPKAPEATDCITVNKVFSGLTVDEIPEDFSIVYTAVNTKDPQYSTTKTLTWDNAEDFDEDTMTVTWMAPHYSKTGGSTVTIRENCDVDGYTYTTTASKGTVDDSRHEISVSYVNATTKATLTLTNTYTPATVTPENPKLTGFTKTRLTEVPAELGLTGINTDTPVSLKVGDRATLLYAITVTGTEGANYTITDPTATPVDEAAMTGTIDSTGTATVYVTKTITIDDVVEGYVENIAYVEAGADTDPIPGTEQGSTTPSAPVKTRVKGEMVVKKTHPETESKVVEYTIRVTNQTGMTQQALRLVDTLDEGLSFVKDANGNVGYTIKLFDADGQEVPISNEGGEDDGLTMTWAVVTMIAPKAELVITYEAEIAAGYNVEELDNTIDITSWDANETMAAVIDSEFDFGTPGDYFATDVCTVRVPDFLREGE